MSRVMIVDDEEAYLRQLEAAIRQDGHETRTATCGREAIDLGARYCPDVLVTDWMLSNHLHGLHVSRALRAVHPDVETILITGFPSGDLQDEAHKTQIDFIEKPFGADRLRTAIRRASASRKTPEARTELPLMDVGSDGTILFANAAAKALLSETAAGAKATSLTDVFGAADLPDLDLAIEDWISATAHGQHPVEWSLRSQPLRADGGRLVVLQPDSEGPRFDRSLVDIVLGTSGHHASRWPIDGRVLVVDDETMVRRAAVALLEGAGAGCYAVADPTGAQRLLARDKGICVVVHDYNLATASTASSIEAIRHSRPDVIIVGTSSGPHRADFLSLGVDRYVSKPWRIDQLIDAVAGRVGGCVECDLPLPLRRATTGETPLSWVCTYCGARYRGLLDPDASPNIRRNARPADPT
ncbi:MAG: response regulator [bacterium]|nr:response regulator [bacterium]